MENSWLSNIVGTVGWTITFAIFGGLITILLWLSGIVIGYLLRGTPQ